MALTEADRKFIMKVASQYGALNKRVARLEKRAQPGATMDELFGPQTSVNPLRSVLTNKDFTDDQAVEVVFKGGKQHESTQRILVESLYKLLRELCVENEIDTLQVRITNH